MESSKNKGDLFKDSDLQNPANSGVHDSLVHYVTSPDVFPKLTDFLCKHIHKFDHKLKTLMLPVSCASCISGQYCGNRDCVKKDNIYLTSNLIQYSSSVLLLQASVVPMITTNIPVVKKDKHKNLEVLGALDAIIDFHFSYKVVPVTLQLKGKCIKHCSMFSLFKRCPHNKFTEDKIIRTNNATESVEVSKIFYRIYVESKVINDVKARAIVKQITLYRKYNHDAFSWLVDDSFLLLTPSSWNFKRWSNRKLIRNRIYWMRLDSEFDTWYQNRIGKSVDQSQSQLSEDVNASDKPSDNQNTTVPDGKEEVVV